MDAQLLLTSQRTEDGRAEVLVSVQPPDASERLPSDVCIVVDVSGSMQVEATVKGATGTEAGSQILSVLDLVRHAIKTIIKTMESTDRLGIVAYSDKAITMLELRPMDDAGREEAFLAVDALRADGQTNLWDGLSTGLGMLRNSSAPRCSSAVLLFTDGVPNVEPTGGHIPALRRYIEDCGGRLPGSLHTFGFGKDLDSRLLSELACVGQGMYSFMPDASMVGTALVNSTANTLVTMGRNATLLLEPVAGVNIEEVLGYSWNTGAQGTVVDLGCLQFGQSKDLVLVARFEDAAGPKLSATLKYDGPEGEGCVRETGPTEAIETTVAAIGLQAQRLRFAELVPKLMSLASNGDFEAAVKAAESFAQSLAASGNAPEGLQEDVEGQVCQAVSREDWYQAWGGHYLLSLARAHLVQQCHNFKDPGVQVYGGPLFEQVRDAADEVFVSLPPPNPAESSKLETLQAFGFTQEQAKKALEAAHDDLELAAQYCIEGIPSRPPPAQRRGGTSPAANFMDMRAYYNSAGPCFGGDAIVAMEDGTCKQIRMLRKGDRVVSRSGSATVRCIVKTATAGRALLVTLPCGTLITPWHPVLFDGAWTFPSSLAACREEDCEAVYNLVLDEDHVLRIGNLWTVSLGHQLKCDVVQHSYWGDTKVISDLQRLCGWADGIVELGPGCVRRDEDGQVCGLNQIIANT